jgi:hypothetical protein
LFWLAFSELNENCKVSFLKHLWSQQNLPDEIYHYDVTPWDMCPSEPEKNQGDNSFFMSTGLSGGRKLPAPVFVELADKASESGGCSVLEVSQETCTIAIPRYRSVSDAAKQLILFLKDL